MIATVMLGGSIWRRIRERAVVIVFLTGDGARMIVRRAVVEYLSAFRGMVARYRVCFPLILVPSSERRTRKRGGLFPALRFGTGGSNA